MSAAEDRIDEAVAAWLDGVTSTVSESTVSESTVSESTVSESTVSERGGSESGVSAMAATVRQPENTARQPENTARQPENTARQPAPDGEAQPSQAPPEESGIRTKAKSGHSPSARALVNAADTVARLAAMAATTPPSTLRSRVLASAMSQGTALTLKAAEAQASGQAAAARLPPPVAIEIPGPMRVGEEQAPMQLTSPNELLGRIHTSDPTEAARRTRIDALHATGAEDAPTSRALALLLEQIAPFFDFEIVLVSAVHGSKTVHRVHRGFPPELGAMDVVPRELSFCTHTVSAGEPFVVENTLGEAFFRSSVLAQTLGARAYIGVPLFSDDIALGALCAISGRPQKISEEDVAFLGRFAALAQALVLHDGAALATMVASDPTTGDSTGLGRVVYTAAFFHELALAEAARFKLQPPAKPSRTVRLALPSGGLPTELVPANVVVAVEGDQQLLVLVPGRHPDADAIVTRLQALGGQIETALGGQIQAV